MSGSYLDSLASLAVGEAHLWRARLPSRFEVQAAWAEDDAWAEELVWRQVPEQVVVERGHRLTAPPRDAPTPDRADEVHASPPAAKKEPGSPAEPAPDELERPSGPAGNHAALDALDAAAHSPEPTPAPVVPAPTLHVTVLETPETDTASQAAQAAPTRAPAGSLGPTPARRRPAAVEHPAATATPTAASTSTTNRPRAEPPPLKTTNWAAPEPGPVVQPKVSVHIDRVEVRAVGPPPAPAPPAPKPEQRRVAPDLEEYLSGGGAP